MFHLWEKWCSILEWCYSLEKSDVPSLRRVLLQFWVMLHPWDEWCYILEKSDVTSLRRVMLHPWEEWCYILAEPSGMGHIYVAEWHCLWWMGWRVGGVVVPRWTCFMITNKRDHVLYETKRSYLNLDGVVLWGRGGGAYRLADKRTGRHTNRYAHWLVNRQIGKHAYR